MTPANDYARICLLLEAIVAELRILRGNVGPRDAEFLMEQRGDYCVPLEELQKQRQNVSVGH